MDRYFLSKIIFLSKIRFATSTKTREYFILPYIEGLESFKKRKNLEKYFEDVSSILIHPLLFLFLADLTFFLNPWKKVGSDDATDAT